MLETAIWNRLDILPVPFVDVNPHTRALPDIDVISLLCHFKKLLESILYFNAQVGAKYHDKLSRISV